MGKQRTRKCPPYKSMLADANKDNEGLSKANMRLDQDNIILRKENEGLREMAKSFLATDAGIDTILNHISFRE